MLESMALLAMFAILLYGIVSVFQMTDSPNPRCFQQEQENFECKCPLQCESNDQRNT